MTRTPLLDRIAARRSAQEMQRGDDHRLVKSLPGPAPTRAPRWLERLQAKDMTGRLS